MNLRINKYKQYLVDISLASSLSSFSRGKNISLDIGCGNGEFIAELALRNPTKYFIGLEIKYGRIIKCLKKAEINKLDNLKFILCDASLLIKEIIPKRSLNKVFINNPDPWPKDRHEKNRLIDSTFLANVHKAMKRKGLLYIKTDDTIYMKTIRRELSKTKFVINKKKSPFDKELPSTKFQELFLSRKKKIYSLKLEKK
ncbi:MAG: tRNA (guanosine(46)-N7)-methyltransferase TrmB [Thermodesulfobacteriota bacterium]|nr:tRNA (guanosine(46)-N7)-methyltransferase TrmB [Thermodesulfobacteriota bacterium]